jgi:hypothetical protein
MDATACSGRIARNLSSPFGDLDPRQLFGAPNVDGWREPCRVIKCPSLDEREGSVSRAVAIDVRAALSTTYR